MNLHLLAFLADFGEIQIVAVEDGDSRLVSTISKNRKWKLPPTVDASWQRYDFVHVLTGKHEFEWIIEPILGENAFAKDSFSIHEEDILKAIAFLNQAYSEGRLPADSLETLQHHYTEYSHEDTSII